MDIVKETINIAKADKAFKENIIKRMFQVPRGSGYSALHAFAYMGLFDEYNKMQEYQKLAVAEAIARGSRSSFSICSMETEMTLEVEDLEETIEDAKTRDKRNKQNFRDSLNRRFGRNNRGYNKNFK